MPGFAARSAIGVLSARIVGRKMSWIARRSLVLLVSLAVLGAVVAPAQAQAASFDVTISTGATSGGSFSGGNPNVFTPTASGAVLNVTDLESALDTAPVVVGSPSTTSTIAVDASISDSSASALIFEPAAGISISAASISTGGSQTYGGAVSLSGSSVDLSGGTVTFDSTLDGASDLLVGGDAVSDGQVGSSTPLKKEVCM